MVSRGNGIPDEDAPHDVASMRFWVSTGMSASEKDRTTITGSAETAVAASAASVLGLAGAGGMPVALTMTGAAGQALAAGDPPSAPGNGPSPQELLAGKGPGKKGKGKGKDKGDPSKQALPKTPVERRTACRALAIPICSAPLP